MKITQVELSYKVGEAWKKVCFDEIQKPSTSDTKRLEVIANITTPIPAREKEEVSRAILEYHRRHHTDKSLSIKYPQT